MGAPALLPSPAPSPHQHPSAALGGWVRVGCCPLLVGSRHCPEGACRCGYHLLRCPLQPASARLPLRSPPEALRIQGLGLLTLPDGLSPRTSRSGTSRVLCKGDRRPQRPAERGPRALVLPPRERTEAGGGGPAGTWTQQGGVRIPCVAGQGRSGPLGQDAVVRARPRHIKNSWDELCSHERTWRGLRDVLLSEEASLKRRHAARL